jgi:hypothetical protein
MDPSVATVGTRAPVVTESVRSRHEPATYDLSSASRGRRTRTRTKIPGARDEPLQIQPDRKSYGTVTALIIPTIPPPKVHVVAAVIGRRGRLLLGKRSLSKTSAPGYWTPIVGRIEAGESEEDAVSAR